MAKVAFSKLNTKVNTGIKEIVFNDQVIEVKEYLPFAEKVDIVEKIVNIALNNHMHYYNPAQMEVFEVFYIISSYTNLSFTPKQQEDLIKLYDHFVSSGLAKMIINEIDDEELQAIESLLQNSLKEIYNYHNSIFSLLEILKDEQNFLDNDIQNIANTLSDKAKELSDLKDILVNA